MADSSIGALPQAPQVDDESLLVMEQQGQAMKITGTQLKEYAKRGVELEFQNYLDEAKAAADSAAGAVSAVTGMTVEAHSSDTPTVTKTTWAGKVNLNFGLPRGERGEPGPEGPQGLRGPQGAPGNGLTILGHYDTEDALRAAVTAPKVGDAYSVGLELPYDTYIFDGVTMDWKNHGPLSGGGGGTILPENVVTTPGGAELAFASGDGPHTVAFTFEEESPLTAEDIVYGEATVQEAMEKLFTSVSDGKTLIASAITDKGVETAQDATFAEMAANIGQITTGSSTEDATATPGDILAGKTAYTAAGKVEGLIPTLASKTYTPGTAAQTIADGQYLGGTQTIQGDPNLTSSNIKKGVSIFGVAGAMESSFQAVLTVKADTGAVVTATHTDGTQVEALSTNGQVAFELPQEGTWKVTAVRGMAQYNTVTIEVSSQYSAELTAEVHIVYYGAATGLSVARYHLAAATVEDYAVFAGGLGAINANGGYGIVDAYNKSFVRSEPTILSKARGHLGGTSIGQYVLFAGGIDIYHSREVFATVDAYNAAMTQVPVEELSKERYDLGAVSVGNYALFAGGSSTNEGTLNTVDAYDTSLTHSIPTPLMTPNRIAADSNGNYAILGGYYGSFQYTAYDKNLTRTVLTATDSFSGNAVRAGNYVLFRGTDEMVAFDLFLTKTLAEGGFTSGSSYAGTTVNDMALIGGHNKTLVMYDPFLVRTTADIFNRPCSYPAATALGNFALFGGGGLAGTGRITTVDIYQYV